MAIVRPDYNGFTNEQMKEMAKKEMENVLKSDLITDINTEIYTDSVPAEDGISMKSIPNGFRTLTITYMESQKQLSDK